MQLISSLSKSSGIPIHTIRYYEKYGLIKGKKDATVKSNNYTWYDNEVLEKLELIKEARKIGFSLAEMKTLIDAWHSKRFSPEKKKEILGKKVEEIELRILHLKKVKKMLTKAIKEVEQGLC